MYDVWFSNGYTLLFINYHRFPPRPVLKSIFDRATQLDIPMMSVVSLATSCALMKRLLAQRKLRSTRGLQDPELPIERTIVIVSPSLAS